MRFDKTAVIGGTTVAIIHFTTVIFLYCSIVFGNNSDAVYGWMLLLFIDYPISLGMGFRSFQIEGNFVWNNGILPGLYFGILGTGWWFMLGYIVSRVVVRVIKKLRKKGR